MQGRSNAPLDRNSAVTIGVDVRIGDEGGVVQKLARPKVVQDVAPIARLTPLGSSEGRGGQLARVEHDVGGSQAREAHACAAQQVGLQKKIKGSGSLSDT